MGPWLPLLPFTMSDLTDGPPDPPPPPAPTSPDVVQAATADPRVAAQMRALLPGPGILDRRLPANGADLLNAAMAKIALVFSSDTDAAYYIAWIAVQQARRLVAQAQQLVSEVDTDVAAAHAQPATRVSSTAQQALSQALLLPTDTPAQRLILADQVGRAARACAETTQDAMGRPALGKSPSTALQDLVATLPTLQQTLSSLSTLLDSITALRASYAQMETAAAPLARQLQAGRQALAAIPKDAPGDAAISALLLASLLEGHGPPPSLLTAKYSGPITALASTQAGLLGGPVPFLPLPDGSNLAPTVSLSVAGVAGALAVTEPAKPRILVPSAGAFMRQSESGAVFTLSSPGAVSFSVTLKAHVLASSIQVLLVDGTLLAQDNGTGGWTSGSGSVDYATGVLSWSGSSAVAGKVFCHYTYDPLGLLAGMNALTVVVQNSSISKSLTTAAACPDVATLAARITAAFTDTGLTAEVASGVLCLQGPKGGSAQQLLLPAGTAAQLNDTFGSPTWQSTPTTLNAAIGALAPLRAQGADVTVRDITGPSDLLAAIALSVVEPSPIAQGSVSMPVGSRDFLPADAAVQTGDSVDVTGAWSSTHLVTAVYTDNIAIFPEVPASLAGQSADQPIQYVVRRRKLSLLPADLTNAIQVTGGTHGSFGLAGTASPQPHTMQLLSAVAPGSSIRPGDLAYQADQPVASVSAIGTTKVQLSASLADPTGDIVIRSLGSVSYDTLRSVLAAPREPLVSGRFLTAAALYGVGDIAQAQYATELANLTQLLTGLSTALADFRANTVQEVVLLLDFLRSERYTGAVDALVTLDLKNATNPSVAGVSTTAQASDLLGQLTATLPAARSQTTYTTVPDDFAVRPRSP